MISLARFRFSKSAGSAISRSSSVKRSRLRSTRELKSMGVLWPRSLIAEGPGSTIPAKTNQLSFSRRAGTRGLGAAVAPGEFLHPPGRIDELLFAGEKRMARRANADFNVPLGRARVIDSAASANDIGLVILWMNVRFHVWKRGANCSALRLSGKG